jgi:hypothetical protein
MLAATTVPCSSAQATHPGQTGAERVAAALRFARDEALRTAQPHGVALSTGTDADTLKVFLLDTGTLPPTPQFSVRHPCHASSMETRHRQSLSGGPVDAQGFVSALGSSSQLIFTADGAPPSSTVPVCSA